MLRLGLMLGRYKDPLVLSGQYLACYSHFLYRIFSHLWHNIFIKIVCASCFVLVIRVSCVWWVSDGIIKMKRLKNRFLLWKCSSEFNLILYAANLCYIPGHSGVSADKPVAQRKILVHNRDLGDITRGPWEQTKGSTWTLKCWTYSQISFSGKLRH